MDSSRIAAHDSGKRDVTRQPSRGRIPVQTIPLVHVSEPHLAWTGDSVDPASCFAELSQKVTGELRTQRDRLQVPTSEFATDSHAATHFPLFNKELLHFRQAQLHDGFGVLVIRGTSLPGFTDLERRNIYWTACRILGVPLPQNERGEFYISVRDMKQRMTAGGRYHQSNEGGELHTDSPQYPQPPDYVGLYCVHAAYRGGESRLLSAYSVHNALLEEDPALLAALYDKFHFEQRGSNPVQTTLAPIFQVIDGRLMFRYLGSYVRSGHDVMNAPLSYRHHAALRALDVALSRDDLILDLTLQDGDMLFFDNARVVHGRKAFEDDPTNRQPPRELDRAWIRRAA